MNLHVFNDTHGFFLITTVKRFAKANALDNNLFINLNDKAIYRDEKVVYLRKKVYAYKRAVRSLDDITSVFFYPFDDAAAWFLRELKLCRPAVQVRWIFWGYEYYCRPDRYIFLLDGYSSQYYKKRQILAKEIKSRIIKILKVILRIPVFDFNLLKQGYQEIDVFYSFLPEDYRSVNLEINNRCQYRPISFLSVEEMTKGLVGKSLGSSIMVGHSAAPTGNHVEILHRLSDLRVLNRLFLPLEYGEKAYRAEVKRITKRLFGDQAEILEKRLEMKEYYQKLSHVGFAVFGFRTQEALGNIVFLTWNGAKVFLNEESTVYRQFKSWGLTIFSTSVDLTQDQLSKLLPLQDRIKNKDIIENLLSEEKVRDYWEALMS